MIGYDYFTSKNFLWRHLEKAILPLTMPHIPPKLNPQEARELLKEKGALLFRWDEQFDHKKEGEWWHIIKDEAEDISLLAKKTRYMIRKGGKSYDVKPCESQYIRLHGYPVYKAAFERYETFEKCFSEEEFKSGILSLPDTTEFWGAFDKEDNRLVAFSENFISDAACFYSTMWFEPIAMKNFAGYVLFHEMNKHYLNDRKLKYVSDGARSINHETNIHDFLISKFRFRKAYSNLKVVYAPQIYSVIIFLYPLRKLFKGRSSSVFQKVHVLMEQERIRRSCELRELEN